MLGMYPNDSIKLIPDKIWCDEFFTCIINLCLDPQSVGFNLNDLEVSSQLPIKTKTFLKLFTQHAKPNVQNQFKNVCKKHIDDKNKFKALIESIKSLKVDKSSTPDVKSESSYMSDWIKLSQLVNGYEQLSEFNLYTISLDFNTFSVSIKLNFLSKIQKFN